MTTKLIGIKEFAKNLSKILQESQENNVHFVVMRHTEPVANITPIKKKKKTNKEIELEKFAEEIAQARAEYKRGEYYTEEEICKKLGIKL
ncbi:hypothetical protein KJ652_02290 [Patescibacteria group bacterium]|nr:hypothetical protein [Patescibacteria group bacterium]MBU1123395.1 hypothetical protein [Patescibacteria group bacterium]MBU1911445.1 hypothetical protein [Patescibacteria group bacterium]